MRVIPVSLLFMLVAAVAPAERPSQLEVVLDKHRAAIIEDPSKAAVESVQYDLTIEEPAFTVTAAYRASRDGRMRIDVYDGATRVFSEGLGRDGGWQWPAGSDELLQAVTVAEIRVNPGVDGMRIPLPQGGS